MIAVAFALGFEAGPFRKKGGTNAQIWEIGAMGESFLAGFTALLDREKPSLVISAGLAGALQSGLEAGDLFLASNFSDPAKLAGLTLPAMIRSGSLETVDSVLTTGSVKRSLGKTSGALMVDMETARLAARCRDRQIPLIALRAISDSVDEDLPVPPEILADPASGQPDVPRLLAFLALNPGRIPAFVRMVGSARKATQRLAEGLEILLHQLV